MGIYYIWGYVYGDAIPAIKSLTYGEARLLAAVGEVFFMSAGGSGQFFENNAK